MVERTEQTGTAIEQEPHEMWGTVIAGTYRLLERIGTGGMADVYEAEHLRLGNRVAVKLLRLNGRTDRTGVERFQREARRVATLSSEHIVKVFDCGELPSGTPYLTMERLLGEDLRSLLAREGRLPIRRAVELAIGACRGLSVVHAAGLVHRDLKPANLFVVRGHGGADWCKILDFGVAKTLVSDVTADGALLGTVRYMAPEQLEDASSARATADVYAVGAILYECLTGTPPHEGSTLQELMFDIVHRDAKPPSEFREMPEELESVILRALSRDSEKRFASAEELALSLAPYGAVAPRARLAEGIADETLAEASGGLLARAPSRNAKRKYVWLAGGLGATIIAMGIAHSARGRSNAKPADTTPSKPSPSRFEATMPPAELAAAFPSTSPVPTSSAPADEATPKSSSTPAVKRTKPVPKPSATASAVSRFDSRDPYSD